MGKSKVSKFKVIKISFRKIQKIKFTLSHLIILQMDQRTELKYKSKLHFKKVHKNNPYQVESYKNQETKNSLLLTNPV